MPAIFIDSNVLLDIFTDDQHWRPWSLQAVAQAANRARLVINAVVYAEISVRYASMEDVDALLPAQDFEREPIPFAAAFMAGKAHEKYRRLDGSKTAPLPDFLIGAHALSAGHTLLTRDAARYRSYFPDLPLITPER